MGKLLGDKRAVTGEGQAEGAAVYGEVHGGGHRERNADGRWERRNRGGGDC